MNLTVVTQPPFEPVTLEDVYDHLRLDTEGSPSTHVDDERLTRLIQTARKHVEAMTRLALIQQTLRLSYSMFPVSSVVSTTLNSEPRRITLLRPPIISVSSVQYFDSSNVLQTVNPGDYYVTDEQCPELRFASSFTKPTLYDRPDALRVNYVAGHIPEGSPPVTQAEYASAVPAGLKDAILLGVQLLYDELRPDEYTMLEKAQEALVQPYRIQLIP